MRYCMRCGRELNANENACACGGVNSGFNYNAERSFIGIRNIVEFDNANKLFGIKSRKAEGRTVVYSYAHLFSAEHFRVEKEIIVTKTSPGSMLGRAAVGGLLFGGIGAVVGGATARTTAKRKSKLRRQYIRLYLNSFESPTLDIDIKCTTDGKRIAEELFAVLQFVTSTTTDNERTLISTSGIKPIVIYNSIA